MTLAAAVVVCHVLLISGLIGAGPRQPPQIPRPSIQIELIRPEPPLPPPPSDDATTGGGAPATPSRVHVPPEPPPPEAPEPAFIAPPEPAAEPTPQIGAAPTETGEGRGQGGQGEGLGSGVGPGMGSGSGSAPPRLIRAPERAELRALHPRDALRSRRGGTASIRCRIRADGRVEACVALRETPPGLGFGEAAERSESYWRFEPPSINGRPVGGQAVTLRVEFMV
ncbi:TonB family protein [Brevundimonas aveniformis]|uniref:TonB family protein n=1 Tax=Brevundimonas aveniformis TaxID=370977 RepID=UPI0024901551|nr:TonB family protein [Brevundimonas aveniformis]